ncbi:MAG: TetR/AcrR family transcriptional regulator [Bacteroidota bacterium]
MDTQLSSRQMEILIAAVKLIENGGICNVTIKNLAQTISVTEGAIYKHFKSKDEILSQTLEMVRGDVMDVYHKAINSSDTPLIALKNIFVRQAAVFENNPADVVILLSESFFKEMKTLKKCIFLIQSDSHSIVKAIIEKGQRQNQIRSDVSAEQLTIIYESRFRYCLRQWYMSDFKVDIKKECLQAWETTFCLIKK